MELVVRLKYIAAEVMISNPMLRRLFDLQSFQSKYTLLLLLFKKEEQKRDKERETFSFSKTLLII
jgi:hypothetical protein